MGVLYLKSAKEYPKRQIKKVNKMTTFENIKKEINAVKEWNQEDGNRLHIQCHHAQNRSWTIDELSEYLSDNDIADEYYVDQDQQHCKIREIQNSIINYFGM